MGRLMKWMIVLAVVIVVAAPAYANDVVQIWACEMEEGTTEVEVEEIGRGFLKAVRQLDGGEGYNIKIFFPVAVNNTGDVDFYFVFSAPSFTDWGKMWDAYDDDSAMAKADEMSEGKVACPDSAIWESVNIE